MKSIRKIFLVILLVYSISPHVSAQENKVYNNMSLDELLNIDVVVTASKQPEDLFETPLSVTIIKRDEIERSGAMSIPEALRLAPGLIVREITPGNYDIHIRGFDDITKNVYMSLPYNTTTLVMIDNRIVYNYFTGGTLWETFPIDINDVQQIEVVRGPASALYGPNAVTGVINIITTHATKSGMNVLANGTAGNLRAKNANANVGYNWNDKTKLTFTGNFAERYRFDEGYFDYNIKSYTSLDKLTMAVSPLKDTNTLETWTFKDYQEKLGCSYDEDLSLRRLGGNIFFNHRFSEQDNIDIAIGAQKSQSQKTGFYNMATPMSQIESQSYYANARFNNKNLSGQFNIYSGHDFSNYKFNSYKFTNIDANLEYFKQFNKLSFRPGISYKRASYNSPLTYTEPMRLSVLNYEFKNEPRVTSTYAGSLLTEWKPNSKLRVIGAARVDKATNNTNYSFNYEIASTYRINKDNLVRFAHSRASKSTFIFDSYMNCNISLYLEYKDTGNIAPIFIPIEFNILGQKNLKYPTITSQEICWRTKLSSTVSLDIELFYAKVKDFINPRVYRSTSTVSQLYPNFEPDSIVSISAVGNVVLENYKLASTQYGASFSINYDFSKKLSLKFNGTYQKTNVTNSIENFKRTKLEFSPLPNNQLLILDESNANPTQWSDKLTPTLFGSFLLNYKPVDKWNVSSDAYFASRQVFINTDNYSMLGNGNDDGTDEETKMNIPAYIVLNAKVAYMINKNLSAYVTAKNLLGSHREYGFADQIGRAFLVGVRFEL